MSGKRPPALVLRGALWALAAEVSSNDVLPR